MSEFHEKLVAWRSSVAKSFRRREELLDELQGHLEEEAVAQRQQGHDVDESFALAIAKLGDVHALASEFQKIEPPSVAWPPVILVWGCLVASILAVGSMVRPKLKLGGTDALMAIHVASISMGYFSTVALGMFGVAFLTARLFRQVPEGQVRYLLRHACVMAVIATIFTAVGIVVGSVFCSRPKEGPFWGGLCEREVGGLMILCWNFLAIAALLAFRQRVAKAVPLMVVAAAGNAVVAAGWLGALELEQEGPTLGLPIMLLMVALTAVTATTALVPTGVLARVRDAAHDSA